MLVIKIKRIRVKIFKYLQYIILYYTMISYIEFLKNLSMLHETFDIFFGFDCLDDDSVKSEDVIDENKKSPFFFVNYFLDAYEFITKVNRFIFYIFMISLKLISLMRTQ